MIIICPSVEHSGTQFTIDLFKKAGFLHKQPPASIDPSQNVLYQTHFGHKNWETFLEVERTYRPEIIIPIRDLHAIFLSWERRQKSFDVLDERLAMMTEWAENPEVFILPIDSVEREGYLYAINSCLSLELITEWNIIGSEKHSTGEPEESIVNKQEYQRLVVKYGWFFDEIYGRNSGTPPQVLCH